MDKIQNPMRSPGITLVLGSIVGIIFWIVMLFTFLVLGAFVVPPEYQRGIPMIYVYEALLGFVGSLVGLVAGIKIIRASIINLKLWITIIIVLGLVGSLSCFLLEMYPIGIVALLLSILPSIPCIMKIKQ